MARRHSNKPRGLRGLLRRKRTKAGPVRFGWIAGRARRRHYGGFALPSGALTVLDARDLSLSDGATVSSWTAQEGASISGGNGTYEAANANLGTPAVDLVNSSLQLDLTGAPAHTAATIVAVVDLSDTGAVRSLFDTQTPRTYVVVQSNDDLAAFDTAYRRADTATFGANALTYVLKPNGFDAYQKGVAAGGDPSYAFTGKATTVSRIGSIFSGSTVFTWDRSVAFFAYYPRELNASELAQLHGYLADAFPNAF